MNTNIGNLSFSDYVTKILRKEDSLPEIIELCLPCSINYDITLKIESLVEDENIKLFENLTENQLDALSNFYQNDLRIFDFDTDRYYEESYKKYSVIFALPNGF